MGWRTLTVDKGAGDVVGDVGGKPVKLPVKDEHSAEVDAVVLARVVECQCGYLVRGHRLLILVSLGQRPPAWGERELQGQLATAWAGTGLGRGLDLLQRHCCALRHSCLLPPAAAAAWRDPRAALTCRAAARGGRGAAPRQWQRPPGRCTGGGGQWHPGCGTACRGRRCGEKRGGDLQISCGGVCKPVLMTTLQCWGLFMADGGGRGSCQMAATPRGLAAPSVTARLPHALEGAAGCLGRGRPQAAHRAYGSAAADGHNAVDRPCLAPVQGTRLRAAFLPAMMGCAKVARAITQSREMMLRGKPRRRRL